jgi:hypothetical protein
VRDEPDRRARLTQEGQHPRLLADEQQVRARQRHRPVHADGEREQRLGRLGAQERVGVRGTAFPLVQERVVVEFGAAVKQPRQLRVATLVDHDRDPSVRPVLFEGEDPRAEHPVS